MFEFRKSILLVEDEAVIGMTTANALEQEYDVMTVFKGEEAVEVVRSGKKIDLILMDIDLGRGMDGTEAAEIILRDRHIPVVFLSSHTERAVIDKTEKITSYGYVLKDTRYTVLFASIKMAFKLYEARRTISENANKYQILNERIQLAVCSANIGIWDLDVLRNKLIWDERMCEIYGVKLKDLSDDFESWKNYVHPEDAARSYSEVQMALRGEKEFDTEFRIVRPDGSIRLIKAFARVIRDDSGRSVRMTGINYDISERMRAEEALHKSETLCRTLIEASPDAIILFDVNGQIILANPQAASLHGFENEQELIGKNGFDLIAPEDRQRSKDNTPKEVQAGAIGEFDYTLLKKDGSRFIGELRARAILDDSGRPKGFISVVRDISGRKPNKS